MITDPIFYFIAIPALLLVSVSKAGFLNGTAFVGVPLLALVVTPLQAAGIMLPILCFMDIFTVWAYRKHFSWRHLKITLPAGILGIFIGWLTANLVDEKLIGLLVGSVAVIFTLDYWLAWRPHYQPKTLMGTFWGAIAGFTSFVAHAGSPPLQMYMLPQRLEKLQYAGTMALFFAATNAVKLIPYAALGQFNKQNLLTALILLPVAPIGTYLGIYLVKKVPEKPFYHLTYLCVFLIGVKLILDTF